MGKGINLKETWRTNQAITKKFDEIMESIDACGDEIVELLKKEFVGFDQLIDVMVDAAILFRHCDTKVAINITDDKTIGCYKECTIGEKMITDKYCIPITKNIIPGYIYENTSDGLMRGPKCGMECEKEDDTIVVTCTYIIETLRKDVMAKGSMIQPCLNFIV